MESARLFLVVQHTFGRHLNFSPHLHVLVSAGGLSEFESRWTSGLDLNPVGIMKLWRHGVISYLRLAYKAGILKSDLSGQEFQELLADKYQVPPSPAAIHCCASARIWKTK
jgi:hypothetical protein